MAHVHTWTEWRRTDPQWRERTRRCTTCPARQSKYSLFGKPNTFNA